MISLIPSEQMNTILIEIAKGNVSAINDLKALNVVADNFNIFPDNSFCVEISSVIYVLKLLKTGSESNALIQEWAELIRWGTFCNSQNIIIELPFEIRWGHSEFEEGKIIDAVARLEELGDIVDGTIEEDEIVALIKALSNEI